MAEKKLTKKQIRFAQEYARWCNGAKAARLAGYSEATAGKKAWVLLNDPKYSHVQEYVDQLMEDDAAQRKIDHDLLRQRLRSRLRIDMREYFNEDGTPKPPTELTHEQAQHIQSYVANRYSNQSEKGAVQEGENISLKWTSANKAEEMLGKHSGFFAKGDQGVNADSDYLQAAEELDARLAELTPEARELEAQILAIAAAFESSEDTEE